jgi:uncharacterized membrane protein YidH (DUF202 family)
VTRPGVPGDPVGASAERTRLAWRRTALAITVVAVLSTRLALVGGSVLGPALAALVLGGWLVALVGTYRRIRLMAAARPVPARRSLPLAAGAVLGYAAVGVLLVLAAR